jgi:hypothetical protein
MSAYHKTILCLANSRRPGGTCFAGKEFAGGKTSGWIRPVNATHGGAVSAHDRLYQDRSHADLLDIVKVPLQAAKPHLHHQEDHQIDASLFWQKVGRAKWKNVIEATDVVQGPLWINEDSSFHGQNDKVSAASAAKLPGSLYLIEPVDLDLVVGWESAYQAPNVRRVRATFFHNKIHYNFVVTDEPVEALYFGKGDGTYRIEDVRLCVSLAEVLHGNATKLVAAVITPDRV